MRREASSSSSWKGALAVPRLAVGRLECERREQRGFLQEKPAEPKSFNNNLHLQPAAVNPVRHLHLPAKSVDDSSDVSSWGEENFSTTGDESSSTKGCDFGVIPGECFGAIGCKSSSKESSIADLTSPNLNCQVELLKTERKGMPKVG